MFTFMSITKSHAPPVHIEGLVGDVAHLVNPLLMQSPVSVDVDSDVSVCSENCKSAW
jgi:hypothetical protein